MGKYTKAHHNKMTDEVIAQISMPFPLYVASVKSCASCRHFDTEIAQCHKLSELTGCIEYVEGAMICKHYDGHSIGAADSLYGWYEVYEE